MAALVGIAFVIASACVFNNYIDRDIDGLMARTEKPRLSQKRRFLGQAHLFLLFFFGLIGVLALTLFC